MLSRSTRAVLDTALRKYRPGRTDLISVGGIAQLKPLRPTRTMFAFFLIVRLLEQDPEKRHAARMGDL